LVNLEFMGLAPVIPGKIGSLTINWPVIKIPIVDEDDSSTSRMVVKIGNPYAIRG
jgi:hypothetical protein